MLTSIRCLAPLRLAAIVVRRQQGCDRPGLATGAHVSLSGIVGQTGVRQMRVFAISLSRLLVGAGAAMGLPDPDRGQRPESLPPTAAEHAHPGQVDRPKG